MDTLKNDEIANGWTVGGNATGQPYCFEHVPLAWAEALLERVKEDLYVVETINLTYAGTPSDEIVHHNRYFEWGSREAIGLAAYLIAQSLEVAEEVIGTRPATPEEVELFVRVVSHFPMDAHAISDEEAADLPESSEE